MIDLYELEQLIAFDELGTLSDVAKHFHISTPSITRSMQHLEETFGVSLFSRSKNKIILNDTGKYAVEKARKLLNEAKTTIDDVALFEKRKRTIIIQSCAPAPLWKLSHELNTKYPDRILSTSICQNNEVINAIKNNTCDIAILPFPYHDAKPYMSEQLYVCVRKDHELAKHETLNFNNINGFNFLLRSELGFWDTLCREMMPASKFLVQNDPDEFDELVNSSSLPCFVTDYTNTLHYFPDRIAIAITDQEAYIQFYLKVCKELQ